jgi:hypothetical protein
VVSEPVNCPACHREYIPLDATSNRCGACKARRTRVILSIGITTGIVGAAVVAVMVMPRGAEAKAGDKKPEPPPVVQGPPDPNAVSELEKEVVASCDPERIENLLQLMNEEKRYRPAIRAGTNFQSKCKRSEDLDWKILYAHEAIDQWAEAEVIADRLLRDKTSDSDYWWWRGKTRRHLKKHEAAIIDLRQSLSHSTENSNGVQIAHLEKASEGASRPCEAVFGLRWLSTIGVELRSSALQEIQDGYFAKECKKLDGTGEFSWSAEGISKPKGAGKIAGKPVKLVVARRLGTTLVRRDAAEKLGLALGDKVEVMTPAGLATGQLAFADMSIGKASAPQVPIVVVDTLPEDVEAVVGLGFLWRFDVQLSEDGKQYLAKPKQLAAAE